MGLVTRLKMDGKWSTKDTAPFNLKVFFASNRAADIAFQK